MDWILTDWKPEEVEALGRLHSAAATGAKLDPNDLQLVIDFHVRALGCARAPDQALYHQGMLMKLMELRVLVRLNNSVPPAAPSTVH